MTSQFLAGDRNPSILFLSSPIPQGTPWHPARHPDRHPARHPARPRARRGQRPMGQDASGLSPAPLRRDLGLSRALAGPGRRWLGVLVLRDAMGCLAWKINGIFCGNKKPMKQHETTKGIQRYPKVTLTSKHVRNLINISEYLSK